MELPNVDLVKEITDAMALLTRDWKISAKTESSAALFFSTGWASRAGKLPHSGEICADVSMQLFVQLREKALNAYNEISRISL